jgi:hypothetical protein
MPLSDKLKRKLAQKLIEDERRRAMTAGLQPSDKADQRASLSEQAPARRQTETARPVSRGFQW